MHTRCIPDPCFFFCAFSAPGGSLFKLPSRNCTIKRVFRETHTTNKRKDVFRCQVHVSLTALLRHFFFCVFLPLRPCGTRRWYLFENWRQFQEKKKTNVKKKEGPYCMRTTSPQTNIQKKKMEWVAG